MALSRCLEEHAWPRGTKKSYVGYVHPVGYPQTALVCGGCERPGVIWLTDSERKTYAGQERIFCGPNNFARVKADNSGFNDERATGQRG